MPSWFRCGEIGSGGWVAIAIGVATALSVALSH